MISSMPENETEFRRLTLSDAESLTELYKTVEIGRDNYLDKLSDSRTSFRESGGMFLVNDLDRNREILSTPDEVVIGCFSGGELCGMIWYNLSGRNYPTDDIRYFEECADVKPVIEKEQRNGRVLAGKEIIVSGRAKSGTAYLLFEMLITEARRVGITYKVGEVYHIDGYEDETGHHTCDILNVPSYKTIVHTGGRPVGTAPQRMIAKDGIKFYITPQVFLWKINDPQ